MSDLPEIEDYEDIEQLELDEPGWAPPAHVIPAHGSLAAEQYQSQARPRHRKKRIMDAGQNVGREVDIAQGQERGLLELEGDDEVAMPICITLVTPIIATPSTPADLICTARWGTGGVQAFAEIDFINGTTITLCASYIRIAGFHILPSNGTPGINPIPMGAFASNGNSLPSTVPPQRSFNIGDATTIAVGGFVDFPIPNFAHSFRFTRDGGAAGFSEVDLQVLSASTGLLFTKKLLMGAENQQLEPIPVPNEGKILRARNIGPFPITRMNSYFQLAL